MWAAQSQDRAVFRIALTEDEQRVVNAEAEEAATGCVEGFCAVDVSRDATSGIACGILGVPLLMRPAVRYFILMS
jgi:hypothetical protein